MPDEPKALPFRALDALPLFASDREIAVAVVGKTRAAHWERHTLPLLETKGFPIVDALHRGRAVPLVKRFYESYFGLTAGFAMGAPDGEERVWLGKRIENRIDKEERLRADGEDVVERDPGTDDPRMLKAIAECRAKKRAEYAAKKDRT